MPSPKTETIARSNESGRRAPAVGRMSPRPGLGAALRLRAGRDENAWPLGAPFRHDPNRDCRRSAARPPLGATSMWNRTIHLLAACAAFAAAQPASAQTFYTWNGANSQPQIINDPFDWSNPFNWSGGFIPPSSSNTEIQFSAAPVGQSVQNVGNPFIVNTLSFNVGLTLNGNALDMRPNSSFVAQILQSTNSPVAINNNLVQNGVYLFM